MHPCPIPRCVDPDDPNKNAPLITTPICDWHAGKVAVALDRCVGLYVELAVAVAVPAQRSPGDGDTITGKGNPAPLPINVEARGLQEDLMRVLLDAEDVARRVLDLIPRPRRGREGPTLSGAVRFLKHPGHVDARLAQPGGVDFAIFLLRFEPAARRVLGTNRVVRRQPAPCPYCERFGLRRYDGVDGVSCDACGAQLTDPDYTHLIFALTEGMTP